MCCNTLEFCRSEKTNWTHGHYMLWLITHPTLTSWSFGTSNIQAFINLPNANRGLWLKLHIWTEDSSAVMYHGMVKPLPITLGDKAGELGDGLAWLRTQNNGQGQDHSITFKVWGGSSDNSFKKIHLQQTLWFGHYYEKCVWWWSENYVIECGEQNDNLPLQTLMLLQQEAQLRNTHAITDLHGISTDNLASDLLR